MGKVVKEYVLKIGYDPITEEVQYIKEYIENSTAILEIDDKKYELDDEIANYIVADEIGIT